MGETKKNLKDKIYFFTPVVEFPVGFVPFVIESNVFSKTERLNFQRNNTDVC